MTKRIATMAKPFDASLNGLIDEYFVDWANFLASRVGLPKSAARAIDTDLATTVQADRLFRLDGPPEAVLHLELEASGHLGIPEELLRYNVLARHATRLPVQSVVILLRPKATASDLTGLLEVPDAFGQPYITFRYTVIRLWQEPFESLLNAGVGIAPLALLTNEAADDLATAGVRFREWLRRSNLPHQVAKQILGTTGILCGLRYNSDEVMEITMGGRSILEESSVVQEFLRQGRAEHAHSMLLKHGRKTLGTPSANDEAKLKSIPDVARLDRMFDSLDVVQSWNELFAIE
jgi:hypothetical protein